MPSSEKNQSQDEQSVAPSAAVEDWGDVDFEYTNAIQTRASNWDLRILFSERVPPSRLIHKTGVVMSHQQAKAFYIALGDTIEKLEKMMGAPIRFEPNADEQDAK